MKQNFPLKYFYGESANAIKIQIWVTLIANLLLMVLQRGLKRKWSFSGLATMVRITLMYYVDFCSLFNNPEKEWEIILSNASGAPPEPSLFGRGACKMKNKTRTPFIQRSSHEFLLLQSFIVQQYFILG